ncbi:hypothetical protein ACJX0J_019153, partial [Zea mays]
MPRLDVVAFHIHKENNITYIVYHLGEMVCYYILLFLSFLFILVGLTFLLHFCFLLNHIIPHLVHVLLILFFEYFLPQLLVQLLLQFGTSTHIGFILNALIYIILLVYIIGMYLTYNRYYIELCHKAEISREGVIFHATFEDTKEHDYLVGLNSLFDAFILGVIILIILILVLTSRRFSEPIFGVFGHVSLQTGPKIYALAH